MNAQERTLVSVRTISALEPIEGADFIETAFIDGWTVVVKKGEYAVGDSAVYFEPDTFLPDGDNRWQFLVDKSSRMFEGVRGHVLRTVKLKGVYSNGLLLPVNMFASGLPELTKYEVSNEEAARLNGQAKGNFPSFIPKTSAERIQNLGRTVFSPERINDEYEVTIKLDGSSFTVYHLDSVVGCCSRNLELKLEDKSSSFVQMFDTLGLGDALGLLGENVAFQGELFGDGIQGNNEKLVGKKYAIFNVWFIEDGRYATAEERMDIYGRLKELVAPEAFDKLIHVPVVHSRSSLLELGIDNVADVLKHAEGPSWNPKVKREGLVFKSIKDPSFSFKAISESWLAKQK
jgi:RNA ligase (TIGR02306 family)